MWTYFAFDGFCFVLCLSFERKKEQKRFKYRSLRQLNFIRVITNRQIAIDLQSNPRPSRKLPCKKSHFLADDEVESSSIRSAWLKDMTSFQLQKKSRRSKQHSLWQLRVFFFQAKNHENTWKQSERTPSVRTLGPCGAAMVKKKNLLRPSSFLLRRSPSNVRSVMPLHRLLIVLYDYQALSVSLKMDVFMHTCRLQESRSQCTVYRSTEFEVTTCLRRDTVCTSVIVGYGVKMKRRLCVSVQCAGCCFFSPKLTKTSSIQDRLLLSSKRSSLSLYRLRDV